VFIIFPFTNNYTLALENHWNCVTLMKYWVAQNSSRPRFRWAVSNQFPAPWGRFLHSFMNLLDN